jgi:hypothetical protein
MKQWNNHINYRFLYKRYMVDCRAQSFACPLPFATVSTSRPGNSKWLSEYPPAISGSIFLPAPYIAIWLGPRELRPGELWLTAGNDQTERLLHSSQGFPHDHKSHRRFDGRNIHVEDSLFRAPSGGRPLLPKTTKSPFKLYFRLNIPPTDARSGSTYTLPQMSCRYRNFQQ